jgi:AraC family transcriptional regulator
VPKANKRIEKVCDYIDQNLNESLDLESLSSIAAYSKFHFHRVFTAYTGTSVSQYITLARLRRASFRLAFESGLRVTDIAYEAGFDSPEAFARAFKREIGQSPRDFRKEPKWPEWHRRLQRRELEGEAFMNAIDIIDFPDTKIAYLTHFGPPTKVYDTAKIFIEWRKATELSPVKTKKTFGIAYANPRTCEPSEFRWDVCGEVERDVPPNEFGVQTSTIPKGACAVLRHKGSHDTIERSVCQMYNEWLPDSGYETRDFPCFFHYLNFIFEVDECDLLTDIYLPVELVK